MQLLQRVEGDDVVAVGRPERRAARTARELCARAAVVARALPAATPGSAVAFAFGEDRDAFAAALLGAWAAGHVAALPPDARRESVTPVLARPEVVAFLHDTGVGRGIDVRRLLEREEAPAVDGPPSFAGEGPRIDVHDPIAARDRGGSDEPVRLDADELARRVDALAADLGPLARETVASAATPTFAPALLADLLVPLRHGGRFSADVPPAAAGPGARAAAVLADARAAAARVLVGPAALWRQLAREHGAELGALSRAVASTPEALDAGSLARLAARGLTTTSLFADPEVGDAADVRAWLWGRDDLRDAEVRRGPAGCRALIAAGDPGGDRPEALDPGRCGERFVAALEEAGLPACAVRVVPALPRDPNGRVEDADLFRCFGLRPDGLALERELRFGEHVEADGVDRFAVEVPRTYAFFEGHFATYPVMAGAVQLSEVVLPCLRRRVPGATVRKVDGVKFLARIAPGDAVVLELRIDAERRRAGFTIARGDERLSIGRVHYEVRSDV